MSFYSIMLIEYLRTDITNKLNDCIKNDHG
jgi:hypothetical protein